LAAPRGSAASSPRIAGAALPLAAGRRQAGLALAIALLTAAGALIAAEGPEAVGQVTVNGLVAGSYFALGAVGLALVYGVLKLVNFAHGDMLTFGAYIGFLANVTWGLPFALAALVALAATAAFGVATELVLWRPMRAKGAGLLQLLLMTLGLAFVLRHAIQFVAGTGVRALDIDVTTSFRFAGLRIGRTELYVSIVGFTVLVVVAVILRSTKLGKQMRALSDNFALAETAGIDTQRIVIATWILGGALAGLAGILSAAAIGVMTPNLGFSLLLTLFAASVLGGIGNAYGALAGGVVLGLAQEWSTLVIDSRWKITVGFAILILVLIARPQGIFGRGRVI
jgi:neutral amino acid transport system permease protein